MFVDATLKHVSYPNVDHPKPVSYPWCASQAIAKEQKEKLKVALRERNKKREMPHFRGQNTV